MCIQAAGVLDPLLASRPADAHDFPLKTVMNAFVKIEPTQAHLVIRVPLHLFPATTFPAVGRELDLAHAGPGLERALELVRGGITLSESGAALVPHSASGRLALPSDRSFENYDRAVAHVAWPLEPGTTIYFDQGFFDAHLIYPIHSPRSPFAIRTTLAPELKSSLKLAVRYLPFEGATRAYVISSLTGRVPLNPRWDQAASGFVGLGIAHILSGIDHLLFIFALMLIVGNLRMLLWTITSFTVAHSITLALAALGVVHVPGTPVEATIALSILLLAGEAVRMQYGESSLTARWPWVVAFSFGLLHGFGFASALIDVGLPQVDVPLALLSFNVGVELGQIAFVAAMLAVMAGTFLGFPVACLMSILIYIIAALGWYFNDAATFFSGMPPEQIEAAGGELYVWTPSPFPIADQPMGPLGTPAANCGANRSHGQIFIAVIPCRSRLSARSSGASRNASWSACGPPLAQVL